jgi:hypothetical protein
MQMSDIVRKAMADIPEAKTKFICFAVHSRPPRNGIDRRIVRAVSDIRLREIFII